MRDLADLTTFHDFITHWAEDRPDHPALREDGRSYSYGELEQSTAQVVAYLQRLGLAKGDRIAWIGKNSDLYFLLFYGAARLGVVMVPVGWRLAAAEWAFIVNDTKARLLFTGPGFDDVGNALSSQLAHIENVIAADDARAGIASAKRVDFDPAGPNDAVLQLYTSGTTGNPKGAVLSNHNLFGLRKNSNDAELTYTKWDDNEVVLIAMPCAHIGGTGLGIMAVSSGLPGLILPEFTADGFFDAVEQGGVTRLFIVPAALHILLQHPRCASVDFSHRSHTTAYRAAIRIRHRTHQHDEFSDAAAGCQRQGQRHREAGQSRQHLVVGDRQHHHGA